MKYPIGIQDFKSIIEGGFVYVDKTDLVYDMANNGKVYFLSRPRRFGKSLLLSTLKYYFLGEKELFQGLAIDSLETEWKKYPVFHLSFGTGNYVQAQELARTIEGFLAEQEKNYVMEKGKLTFGERFRAILHAAHEQTGMPCVVLIDEYDKPLLDVMDTGYIVKEDENTFTLEEYNRNILKGFYSTFKDADPDLRFVLLTGVTKFSQVSVFSGFNQPEDISMSPAFDALCGITKKELSTVFADSIRDMADFLGYTEEEMKYRLQRQYDGYHFSQRMTDIYNPFSLLNAFKQKRLKNFWFSTGTPTYLVRLLVHSNENLNELTDKWYSESQFMDYKADVESSLPMIYQSGYLTIKDFDPEDFSFKLDFPNNEVAGGFVAMVASSYLQAKDDSETWVIQAQRALKQGDTEKYRDLLTSFLASIPYSARRNENEREQKRYFQYTVYLIMRMMSVYTIYHEKQTSQGRADFVIETPKYVYIFEYKLDHPAAEAIAQIDEKGYAREYANDERPVYKIGCTFSTETGTVSDWLCVEA